MGVASDSSESEISGPGGHLQAFKLRFIIRPKNSSDHKVGQLTSFTDFVYKLLKMRVGIDLTITVHLL